MITIRDVSKTYDDGRGNSVNALNGVNLSIEPQQFVVFLGPSGCGKTTLLKMLDNMVEPDPGGAIEVNGLPAAQAADQIGFVFQDVALLPWRTVTANVALGLQARGHSKDEYLPIVSEFIELVGLERFARYYPWQLSGGMQQRVGLARALAISPKVLLMDEPFGALDAMTRKTLQHELLRIWESLKVTVVFVTHDVQEAIFLADRIIVFGANPGRVEADLTVPLPRPRQEQDVATNPAAAELHVRLTTMLETSQ